MNHSYIDNMFLAVDMGNSNVVFGIYDGKSWSSHRFLTADVLPGTHLADFLSELKSKTRSSIETITVSSVVPSKTKVLQGVLEKSFSVDPHLIKPADYKRLPITITNPEEIGTDLVCNAIAADEIFKSDCMVIDFGTALTFTIIEAKTIRGVNIAPGLETSMKTLVGSAAQLKEIPLELPKSVIGTDTTTAIQSGILWGYVGLVERMIDRIEEELGKKLKIVATGGLSEVLKPLANRFDKVDGSLTLEGIRLISELDAFN